MSGEVARWRANAAVERRLSRELAALEGQVSYTQATAVGHVARREAVQEALPTSLVCDQAERMSRSGTEHYRLQALTGAIRDGRGHPQRANGAVTVIAAIVAQGGSYQ